MVKRRALRQQSRHSTRTDIGAVIGELKDRLPAEITTIEKQKHNADRVSLFLESGFLVGISVYAIAKKPVMSGDMITEGVLRELLEWDQYAVIKRKILDYLARRPHSRSELRTKTQRAGFARQVTDQVLSELAGNGYIDDSAFAEAFTRDKFRNKRWGPNRIRSALKQKGVSEPDAEKAIGMVADTAQQEQQIRTLLQKIKPRLQRVPEILKRKKKAYDFLIRKGYRHSDVIKIMEQDSNYL
jgi:regulatory protein